MRYLHLVRTWNADSRCQGLELYQSGQLHLLKVSSLLFWLSELWWGLQVE